MKKRKQNPVRGSKGRSHDFNFKKLFAPTIENKQQSRKSNNSNNTTTNNKIFLFSKEEKL